MDVLQIRRDLMLLGGLHLRLLVRNRGRIPHLGYDAMTKESCQACRFWKKDYMGAEDGSDGFCHLLPPLTHGRFTVVNASDWCGQFQPTTRDDDSSDSPTPPTQISTTEHQSDQDDPRQAWGWSAFSDDEFQKWRAPGLPPHRAASLMRAVAKQLERWADQRITEP
jgi:hypothetical protein